MVDCWADSSCFAEVQSEAEEAESNYPDDFEEEEEEEEEEQEEECEDEAASVHRAPADSRDEMIVEFKIREAGGLSIVTRANRRGRYLSSWALTDLESES